MTRTPRSREQHLNFPYRISVSILHGRVRPVQKFEIVEALGIASRPFELLFHELITKYGVLYLYITRILFQFFDSKPWMVKKLANIPYYLQLRRNSKLLKISRVFIARLPLSFVQSNSKKNFTETRRGSRKRE